MKKTISGKNNVPIPFISRKKNLFCDNTLFIYDLILSLNTEYFGNY